MSVRELKLEVDKETARGRYANVAIIAHTKDEFILDFALAYPGQSPVVGSRVITSPQTRQGALTQPRRQTSANTKRGLAQSASRHAPPQKTN